MATGRPLRYLVPVYKVPCQGIRLRLCPHNRYLSNGWFVRKPQRDALGTNLGEERLWTARGLAHYAKGHEKEDRYIALVIGSMVDFFAPQMQLMRIRRELN